MVAELVSAARQTDRPNTLLVLDDEPDITSCVRDLVEITLPDCQVITASTCLEALQALERVRIDAAIVDFRMPHHNGFDFIERARRLEPGLPILLMSAYNSVDLAAKAVHFYHVQGVLAKPLDPFELTESVAMLMRATANGGWRAASNP